MGAASDAEFTLFVSGTLRYPTARPKAAVKRVGASLVRPFATLVLPRSWTEEDLAQRGEDDLDPASVTCVNLVAEAAERAGRSLRIVNVEDPTEDRGLIARWVTPDRLLPLLARSDGAILSASESFTPRAVRQFVAPR